MQWKLITDELPKKQSLGLSDFVLTFNGEYMNIDRYNHELNRFGTVIKNSVTHWMPLPKNP